MPADLRLAANSEADARDAFYKQMRFDGDAKNRLPAAFIKAASEAIALEEMGIENLRGLTGGYEEKAKTETELTERIEELTAIFKKSNFITCDDSEKDPHNDGQLLKITIDLDKTKLSDNQKPTAQKAIREKIIWMGYCFDDNKTCQNFVDARQGTIKMIYPAYNR